MGLNNSEDDEEGDKNKAGRDDEEEHENNEENDDADCCALVLHDIEVNVAVGVTTARLLDRRLLATSNDEE